MKKATLLAPRNAAREMLSEVDIQRLLDSGSWVIATIPKKPTAGAINQRNYFQRRLEAGFRKFQVLLPEHVFNALHGRRHKGETVAEMLERLLAESDTDNEENSKSGATN